MSSKLIIDDTSMRGPRALHRAGRGFTVTMIGAVAFHAKAVGCADSATRGNAMAPVVLTAVSAATAVTLGLAV